MASAELDSYMMDYHPYKSGTNPFHTPGSDSQNLSYAKQGYLNYSRKTNFYGQIKSWLQKQILLIAAETAGPIVLTIAPGHEATQSPTGFMHEVVGQLLGGMPQKSVKVFLDRKPVMVNLVDGRNQLIRTQTVPKQSQTPGARNEATHRGTIAIKGDICNEGKTVIILDDVWTSGSTLRACSEVMLTTNPSNIKLFAIGKTVSEQLSFVEPPDFCF